MAHSHMWSGALSEGHIATRTEFVIGISNRKPGVWIPNPGIPCDWLQTTPLIWRPSLLKYNSRIAQTMQWLQAIQS